MDKLLPLIVGFLGAIVGAGASIITMHLQNKAQTKREKMKLATELGLEDFKAMYEIAKTSGRPFALYPVACFVHFHSKLLELLEKGELNEKKIKEIMQANKRVIDAFKEANEEYKLK
jgi:hypothetical protein